MAEAADRLLQPRDLLLLGHVALPLALELELRARPCRRSRRRARSARGRGRARRSLDDALVEQVAVVGDHQHRAVEVGDEPLELVAPAHVEVRLGLVEQQHVGAAREAGGERDELALAAAELAGRALERLVVDAEVAQVHPRLALHAVAAELGPAGEQPLLVGERAGHRVEVGGQRGVGEPPLGGVQLGLQLGDLGPRGEHGGERRALVAGDLLRQEGVARARGGASTSPASACSSAGEDPQQRRLAAAVGAEHADPRAVGQLEVEPVEDAAAAERLRRARGRRAGGRSPWRDQRRGAGERGKVGRPHPWPSHPSSTSAGDRPDLVSAVEEGGGRVGPLEDADGLVWLGGDPAALPELPDARALGPAPVGRRRAVGGGGRDRRRRARSRRPTGAFGLPVAEHALALMLAADKALHRVRPRARVGRATAATTCTRSSRPDGRDRRRGRHRARADRRCSSRSGPR